MDSTNGICNRIRLRIENIIRYVKLWFWWIRSYETSDSILLELSREVATSLGVKPFKKVKIAYRDDIINAAAIGFLCRTLVLSQGILNTLTFDELKTVILHEYAHCQQRHHVKLLATGLSIALTGALPYLSIVLYIDSEAILLILAGIIFTLTYIAMLVFTRYLTRRFEEEADLIVVKNLENPRLYLQVLQKIALRHPNGKIGLREKLFSSHPSVSERLHKLCRYMMRCGGPGGI